MAARIAFTLTIALLARACMGGDESPGAYTEKDLPSIVRGALDAPEGWTLD